MLSEICRANRRGVYEVELIESIKFSDGWAVSWNLSHLFGEQFHFVLCPYHLRRIVWDCQVAGFRQLALGVHIEAVS